jgi:periplasmic divalent cation tolerance protein
MKLSLGYLTFPTKSEAQNIILALLDENLIACGNILPPVESFFAYEGEIQKANEVVAVVKTRRKNEDKIIKMIRRLHSYEIPCVVFVPIEDGNPAFMDWVDQVS